MSERMNGKPFRLTVGEPESTRKIGSIKINNVCDKWLRARGINEKEFKSNRIEYGKKK